MSNLSVMKNNSENKYVPVYDLFNHYFESLGIESNNTRKSYERAVRDFVKETRNKELENMFDIDCNFSMLEIEKYQLHLRKEIQPNSVNLKMTAIKKCFEKLKEYGVDTINPFSFNVKKLKNPNTNSYSSLSREEVKDILEFLKTLSRGNEKSLFVEFAFTTAFRKQSILDVEWSNVRKHNDDESFIVEIIGKGNKKDTKKISKDLHDRLKEIKREDNNKIFNFSHKTIQRMMDNINENFDFGSRNITFHSFKKASINEVARITNYDIKAMQRQGNHSSVRTTLEIYMDDKNIDDLVQVDINKEIDMSKLNKLSKRELLKLIKSLDNKTKNTILNKI